MPLKDPERWLKLAKRAGEAMQPPPINASPREVMIWRWIIVIGVFSSLIGLTAQIILAWGILPAVFTGFAHASDTKGIDAKIEATRSDAVASRIELLEWRIFDLRIEQCDAIKSKENARVYTYQIDELAKKYRVLTQLVIRLPDCGELE